MTRIFQISDDPIVAELWDELYYELDGTENCYDPLLVGHGPSVGDSVTDKFVEGWANGNASKRQAEELCAGCHVIEQCKAYAMAAQEPNGIWGGTRPRDRGILPERKRRKTNGE